MKLTDMKGLGPTRLSRLRAMGIVSLRDLLYFFPTKFEDHIHITPISEVRETETLVRGTLRDRPKTAWFHGVSRVTASIRDGSGTLSVCWFNEPWMVQQLSAGQTVLLYGRINVKNGARTLQNPRLVTEQRWEPVYRTIRGFPAKSFRELMNEALSAAEEICPETLPASLRARYHLMYLPDAIRQRHFPDSTEALAAARRRLNFESFLIYLTGVSLSRHRTQAGFAMPVRPAEDTEAFWNAAPFPPTGAQRRVLMEIAEDLGKDRAMSRLVQGDVGCGKTILAFGAIFLSRKSGFQSAMMAPTEILARQHYENARSLLEPMGIRCRLLTGSTRAAERKKILAELKNGECHAVFGTHALISEGVDYARLGLAVTDEQHRFGVRQRSRLQEKGMPEKDGRAPHVLVMSATPIPRTLALILYGDLDFSLVDELPPGRKPVQTRLVPQEKRSDMYQFLRGQTAQGKQAYVVCPLVEDSDALQDVKSAKTLFEELTAGELRGLRVGLTWGTQKAEEKLETLRLFSAGELDVLVATTVIEVGVNVPSATVMVIENAERYGLSQLHQLRGRVGRGSDESWCFLLSGAPGKLRILCETNDGFEVARKDLEMRGPGDLMGTRQSGDMTMPAAGVEDIRLLEEAKNCVRDLETDPALAAERSVVEKLALDFFEEKEIRVALN